MDNVIDYLIRTDPWVRYFDEYLKHKGMTFKEWKNTYANAGVGKMPGFQKKEQYSTGFGAAPTPS